MNNMTLGEIMLRLEEGIAPTATALQATDRMRDRAAGWLPVVEQGRAVGVIRDMDVVLCAVVEGRDPSGFSVRDAMTLIAESGCEDEELRIAAKRMMQAHALHLLVLARDGAPVGVAAAEDVLGIMRMAPTAAASPGAAA